MDDGAKDAREDAPKEREEPSLLEKAKAAPVTFGLAAINVVAFLWSERFGDTTLPGVLLQVGGVERTHVWLGDYWRLGSHMFLHVGWVHLLWNTYASIGWCVAVERVLGKQRFLLVYLLSGLGGGCASVLLTRSISAGASGAMFGIVGATLAIRRRQLPNLSAFWRDPATRSVMINIGIWTAIGVTALNMNHAAHFGGMFVGIVTTWIITAPSGRAARWAAFGVAFAGLAIASARPGWTPRGEDAERLAGYAKLFLVGHVNEEGKVVWPKDVARGERLAERGCARGVEEACAVLRVVR
ncbi:MAG: rhomboid family intramembrane serine protease [Labilithrix sp.]|nr:rhomboid family intramembrane serine protease [Labilithrix sp.]